jgi:hypothetical protein
MRLNWWCLPDADFPPQRFADHVLDRYTQGHGLRLTPEGRDLLHDMLVVVAEDFDKDWDRQTDELAVARKTAEEAEEGRRAAEAALEDTTTALKQENAALTTKVEELEAALAAARRGLDAHDAAATHYLMWREEAPPHPWDKVLKED